ncbi:hypothetical protein Gotur_035359 [Gossypium turneri]
MCWAKQSSLAFRDGSIDNIRKSSYWRSGTEWYW